MKRWHWFSFALLAALFAVTLVVVPRSMGNTKHAEAQENARLELDMDPTNGSGPCNPVDTTVSHNVNEVGNYQVAVCLTGAGAGNEPNAFNFEVTYDDTLNQCVPTACTGSCLDGNPDANMGTTVFSVPDMGPAPGGSYDCSGVGAAPPVCDNDTETGPGHGSAYMGCFTTGSPTLPVGDAVSAPIAEVTFHVIAGGVDNLTLDNVSVASSNAGGDILDCPGGPGECAGGTDTKTGPGTATPGPTATETLTPAPSATPSCGLPGLPVCTPTPKAWTMTPTAAPTETATPAPSGGGGGGGNPPPPPPAGGTGPVVSPPSTGDGSGGVSWAARLIWLMAGLGAISLISGGLYLRRAGTRQ